MDRAMSLIALILLLAACGGDAPEAVVAEATAAPMTQPAPVAPPAAPARPQVYTYSVVNEFPHGTGDFTQGLFIADGVLYETTGRVGQSTLIRHDVLGDAAAHRQPLPPTVFGEGSTVVGDQIITVTWRAGLGIVYDLETLEQETTFPLAGEGWGLTTDGERLILSDGSNKLRFIDPETFEETGSLAITANGKPVPRLNELEYVNGEVWANVWLTEVIVRINPKTGVVTGFIDMSGLYTDPYDPRDNVLNGIAYDAEADRLFVTGKNWPKIYEIEVAAAE